MSSRIQATLHCPYKSVHPDFNGYLYGFREGYEFILNKACNLYCLSHCNAKTTCENPCKEYNEYRNNLDNNQ